MAKPPNLDQGFLPLSKLRSEARQKLVEVLDSCRGKKLLVIDKRASGCLGLVAEGKVFRELGVEQLHFLSSTPTDGGDIRSVLFLVQTGIENAQLVIQQVKHCLRGSNSNEILVYFLPHKSHVCEKMFQEEGISANVNIQEFPLFFVPFDFDLLSLEMESSFKDCILDLDWSSALYMAQGLMQLQKLYGPVPVVRGIGAAAEQVADSLSRVIDSAEASIPPGPSKIDEIIIIDRAVDTVTPMCTQLTYEGMLDGVLGLKHGYTSIPKEGGTKQRVQLNSSDSVFQYIRDKHVGAIGVWLNEQARNFHTGYKDSRDADMSKLKEYTKTLKSLPQIQLHIELLTAIQTSTGKSGFKEMISLEQELLDDNVSDPACQCLEEMICREEPVEMVLRFMCLLSLTQGGVPKKAHDTIYKDILHTYGHQHILTIQRLHSAGLLQVSKGGGKGSFQTLKKGLNLIVDGVDPAQPADPAYVFSGYAPISVRLVQAALRSPAWSGIPEDVLKVLPRQPFTKHPWKDMGHASSRTEKKRRILVAFVGGVTYAEIAALRFLQTRPGASFEFIFATTDFINGSSLMQSFQDEVGLAASAKATSSQ